MNKIILVVLTVTGVVSCSLAPTYQPGKLASLPPVEPAPVFTQGFLTAGDGVRLSVFQSGAGRPAIVVPGGPGVPPAGPWPGLAAFENRYRFTYYHQRGSGASDRPIDRLPSSPFPAKVALLDRKLGLARHILDIEELRLGRRRSC